MNHNEIPLLIALLIGLCVVLFPASLVMGILYLRLMARLTRVRGALLEVMADREEWKEQFEKLLQLEDDTLDTLVDLTSAAHFIYTAFRNGHIRVAGGALADHRERIHAWAKLGEALDEAKRIVEEKAEAGEAGRIIRRARAFQAEKAEAAARMEREAPESGGLRRAKYRPTD